MKYDLSNSQARLQISAARGICDVSSRLGAGLTSCSLYPNLEAQLQAEVNRDTGRLGMGVDAVFVPSSSLFKPGLPVRFSYDMTEHSGELNINGYPWGFFSHTFLGILSVMQCSVLDISGGYQLIM